MSVLVDSSVWVAHFKQRSTKLVELLSKDQVVIHPMIIGELACGTPPEKTLEDLGSLRQAQNATAGAK